MPNTSNALPPLNWLRAFEAAARLMSFTQAGRELGVTQSAISQNVRLLEAHLGQRLFDRLPQRLDLTESGKAYLPAVQDGFGRISAGTREVFGPRGGERVTLRATPGFADFWLAPRLQRLFAEAPDLQLRITSTVWDIEFEAGGADLEIRYGDGNWPGLACEKLATDKVFPVTSPQLGAVLQADPAALAQQRLFHTIGFRVTWPRWLQAAGLANTVDGESGDHFDTAILPLHLAEQGCGVALARSSLVQPKLDAGTLVAPLEPHVPTTEAFFLVWPTDRPMRADAERVVQWLLRTTGPEE